MTHTPSQMPELKPCPVAEAFRRIASKSRNSMGDAEFDIYKENEQDIITVQHFLLTADERAASVPSDLVLCRRVIKPSTHEGDTGYEYFEPVREYAPTDKERAEIIRGIDLALRIGKRVDGNQVECFFTERHLKFIERALTAPAQSGVIKALVEALEPCKHSLQAVTSEKRNIFKNKEQMRQFVRGDIQKADKALALAEKAGGA